MLLNVSVVNIMVRVIRINIAKDVKQMSLLNHCIKGIDK